MGVNKIPLALKFDDVTGNAQGLSEFVLNLSDVGDVCSATPTTNQVLAYSGTGVWCASTIVTGGGGGGGSFSCNDLSACNLSSLKDVCSDAPTNGQSLVYDGAEYCPSSLKITDLDGVTFASPANKELLTINSVGNVINSTAAAVDIATLNAAANFTGGLSAGGSQAVTNSTFDTQLTNNSAAKLDETANFTAGLSAAGSPAVTNSTFDAQLTSNSVAKLGAVANFTAGLSAAGSPAVTNAIFDTQLTSNSVAKLDAVANFTAGLSAAGEQVLTASGDPNNGDVLTTDANDNIVFKTTANVVSEGGGITQSDGDARYVRPGEATNFTGGLSSAGSPTVTNANFGTQLTNNGGLTQTTGDVRYVLSSVATSNQIYFNNAGTPDGIDTTANSRAFLATDANIQNLTDCSFQDTAGVELLVRRASTGVTASAMNEGAINLLFGTGGDGGGEIDFTPSTASTDSALVIANVSADNLNVFKTGQMNPTCYIHESDWLTAGTAANGFGQSNTGTGAGTGQCFDNDVMHPDKGTIGVLEVRSGTDAYGRCFVTTFNNALAVSSCSVSFTSRIAPSGLWVAGQNEGRMCFGLRNGTSNAEATYAMEFQYGQGAAGGGNTWSAVVTDNSNSTVSDTGIVASAQEFQVLQVSCNEDWDTVDFYVDGVNKAQFTLAAGHNIPDSRFNRLGLAWAIRNANSWGSSTQTDGNEIFIDWHQYRLKATTRVSGNRGKDLIQ